MDHTLLTTAGVNRRSSQVQILEAIRVCAKSAMKEYHASGLIGNTKPLNVQHALEISTGLAVEDARMRCGSKVPLFNWNTDLWPEPYRKNHRLPYHFLPDVQMKVKVEEEEDKNSWEIGEPAQLLKEVLDEVGEEQAEKEEKELLGELGGEEKSGKVDATEEIHQGLREYKKHGPPFQFENRGGLYDRALEGKAPEDLTPAEKIRLGLKEAEWLKGTNPQNG